MTLALSDSTSGRTTPAPSTFGREFQRLLTGPVEGNAFAASAELTQLALVAEIQEDAAVMRAERRREAAHGFTRAIAGSVETFLVGRERDVD